MLRSGGTDPDMYLVFLFEPLHNLHLGIQKMGKERANLNLSSDKNLANVLERRAEQDSLIRMEKVIFDDLMCCSLLLRDTAKHLLLIGVFQGESSFELKGFFTTMRVTGLPEGKDFMGVDILMRHSAAFFDLFTGLVQSAPIPRGYNSVQGGRNLNDRGLGGGSGCFGHGDRIKRRYSMVGWGCK